MSFWKHNRNECKRFSKLIKFEVGCVCCICFWLDPWCGEVILKGAFLALFQIAPNKDTYLAHYMHWTNGIIHWDVLFTRSVHDWEMKILHYFLGFLYSHKIGRARTDYVVFMERKECSLLWWAGVKCGKVEIFIVEILIRVDPMSLLSSLTRLLEFLDSLGLH